MHKEPRAKLCKGLVSTELQLKNSPVALHFFNLLILFIQQGKTGVVGPSQTCLAFAFLTLINATPQTTQHKHSTFRVPMAGSYNVNFDWQRTIQDEDLKTAQAATTDTGSLNESIFKQGHSKQQDRPVLCRVWYEVKCTLKFWNI